MASVFLFQVRATSLHQPAAYESYVGKPLGSWKHTEKHETTFGVPLKPPEKRYQLPKRHTQGWNSETVWIFADYSEATKMPLNNTRAQNRELQFEYQPQSAPRTSGGLFI